MKEINMEEFIELINEAKKEAIKNNIMANVIIINENLVKTDAFCFPVDNSIEYLPPMICGLEVKLTKNELPDNVAFAITNGYTEREKLIDQVREDTKREILEDLAYQLGLEDLLSNEEEL